MHHSTQTVMEKAMVIFASPSPPRKKSLISAVSALNADTCDENEDVKSIKSEDATNQSRASTAAASRSSKIDRRLQLSKKRSGGGSTMNMPATAFGGISRVKARGWSLGGDGESSQEGDGSFRSLGSDVVNTLSNVRSKKKRSSLSQPAAEELRSSIRDIAEEDGKNDVSARKRSTLSQPAAIHMAGIMEDEDQSIKSFDSD